MPTTPPPPPRRSDPKGEPPERTYTRRNLAKPEPAGTVALNFRVPAEFKRDFKIEGIIRHIDQYPTIMSLLDEDIPEFVEGRAITEIMSESR